LSATQAPKARRSPRRAGDPFAASRRRNAAAARPTRPCAWAYSAAVSAAVGRPWPNASSIAATTSCSAAAAAVDAAWSTASTSLAGDLSMAALMDATGARVEGARRRRRRGRWAGADRRAVAAARRRAARHSRPWQAARMSSAHKPSAATIPWGRGRGEARASRLPPSGMSAAVASTRGHVTADVTGMIAETSSEMG